MATRGCGGIDAPERAAAPIQSGTIAATPKRLAAQEM
jgi:hypothetical protein